MTPLVLQMSVLDSSGGVQTPMIPRILAQTVAAPSIYNPLANAPFSLGSPFGLQQQLQQQISPWFPSIPAIACGAGLFSFNIEGLPDEGVNIPINDKELMALQIQLDKDNRGLFFTSGDDVSGKILVGKDNIKTNQGDDFDVKNLFNNCRTLAFSSTGDVKIKTPLPATPASDKVNTIILQSPFSGNNPYGPYYSTPATGYPYDYPSTSRGTCSPSYLGICIPPPPPDLNCPDVFPSMNFRVLPPDPHDFDRDLDGIGCDPQDGT
jgi:hypothetical protein